MAQKNKGRPFCILRTLDELLLLGVKQDSPRPSLSAFYHHQEAQSNSSTGIRYVPGHTGVLLLGFYPSKVHPGACLLFFQQIPVVSRLESSLNFRATTSHSVHLEILSLCSLRALGRKICPLLYCPLKQAHMPAARAGV